MKEKIKLIILILIFVGLLFVVNNLLDRAGLKEGRITSLVEEIEKEKAAQNIVTNEVEEEKTVDENIKTTVVASYNDDITENKVTDTTTVKENTNENNVNVVKEITEANFENEVLKSDKTVLIDFYATWCGPCEILSPIVEDVAKENPNLKVVKIDVDKNPNLASKYGAYSIPTLVVIKDGEEANRAVGAIPKEDILELVK